MENRETVNDRSREGASRPRRPKASRRLAQTVLPVAALIALSSPVEAQGPQPEAYCFAVADSGDNLIFINKDGDGFVDMGATGTSSIEAVAFNPDNARLYAIDGDNFGYLDYDDAFDGDGNDSEFVQISADVGTCTLPDSTVLAINDVDGMQFDLTRTDASTGTFVLWATVRISGDDVLVQIDPTTGLTDTTPTPGFTGGASCVRIGGPGIQADIDDISVDPITGELQAVNNSGGNTDQLVIIDPVNGSANQVRFFSNTNPPPVNITDVEGMSFGADGVLYATTGSSGATPNRFWRVNKVDGDITEVAAFPSLGDYEGVACLLDNVVTGTVFFDTDEDATFDATIDVGFAGATVRVYVDNNNDGVVDAGDSLLCNNPGGGFNLACPVTDTNGGYIFPVGQGNFVIDVDTTTLPAGHTLTTDNREEADFAVTEFGERDENNDFGFTLPPGSGDLDITKTSDAIGPVVPGQVVQYTIQVTNNGAITHNAIELDDTLPAGVTYVAQSTVATAPIRDGVLVRDELETKSYGNNDGPDLWSGPWVENDPDGANSQDPTEGEVQIFGRRLRLDNQAVPQANLPSVRRTVDLSGANTRVYFSFDFALDDGVDSSGDDVVIEVDGGSGFVEIDRINGISGAFFGARSYDITSFASAATTIQFRLAGDYSGSTAFESFAADNVMIHGGFGDFRDDFQTIAFTNQSGTLTWATDWLEINEANGANAGDIRIVDDPDIGGRRVLRIRDNDGGGEGVQREVNLTNYTSATLNFDFRRTDLDNVNDYVSVSVSRDGGANWVELDRFEGPADDAVYTGRSYDISSYIASNTRIRFLSSSALGGGDEVYFDNVDILVSTATVGTKDNIPAGANPDLVNGVPPNLVVPLDRFALAPAQTMTVTLRVRVDDPIGNITQLLNITTVTSTESLVPGRAQHIDPVSPGAIIGDRVWLDTDGDGFQDVGEPGLANVTLGLFEDPDGIPGNGDEIARGTTATDGNGNYLFTNVYPPASGSYYVDVSPATVPGGLSASPGNSGRSASMTVTGTETFLDADFGYTAAAGTAIVGDFIWSDSDNDGIQDPGEVGIGGVTVDLVSPGADGIYGNGDDVRTTTTTAFDGTYRFTGVAPGNYRVDVTDTGSVLTGYTLTSGPQSSSDPTSELTVTATNVDLTRDFGYRNPSLFSISDQLWYDADGDGIRDAGESGLAGVTVSLLDGGGNLIGTSVSDVNGDFSFSSVTNGSYTLSITDNTGELASLMGTTAPAIAGSLPVTVAGADVSGVNFGYNQPGTIGEIVWSDADGDGLRDAGEPGIGGVTLDLVEAGPDNIFGTGDDVIVQTATTIADGSYLFTGVVPDTYQVQVTDTGGVLGGYTQTADPDATLDGVGTSILARDASDLTMNFGYRNAALANISGTVFNDTDQDGFEDAGEPGIAGVTIDLVDPGPDGNFGTNDDIVVATTTTDGSGDYSFPDLPNATYRIAVTDTASVLDGYTLSSGLDQIDVSVVGVDITDVDFGYVRDAGTGSIGDRVWMDGDRDGNQSGSEPGIGGVTLNLYDAGPDEIVGTGDDVLLQSTISNNDGNYRFENLPAGNYFVDLDQTTLPAGLAATVGTSDPTAVINLSEGESYEDADFGYSAAVGSSLGDTVFYDADGSGIQEPGEVGIGGVSVTATGPSGTFVVVTNPDGTWLVTGLAPGVYTVSVNPATLPAGYNTTPTNGPISRLYTVVAGQDTLFADFGFDAPAGSTSTVGDTVYLDTDGDSTQDPGEVGMGGVTLQLVDASSNIVASTITAADGSYDFTGVAPGTYTVVVTDVFGVLDGLNATESGGGPIAVPAGTDYNTADFGYAPSGGTGTIGNLVWHDIDGDGFRDPGESGMELVTIELWHDVNGDAALTPGVDNLIRQIVTDLNGEYEIKAVPPGNYLVDVTDDNGVLAGFALTSGAPGVNNNSQSDPYAITLTAATPSNVTADFGYRAASPQTISGLTFYDTAGDGIFNGLDSRIVNVDVFLYRDLNGDGILDSGDARIGMLTSDANGNYLFTDVPDGNYIVTVDTTNSFLTGASQTTQLATASVQPVTIAGAPSINNNFGFTLFATRVVISSFDAYLDGGQVVVEWETSSEVGTVGFYLYRWEAATRTYVQVNDEILPGLIDAPQGGRYRLVDEGAPAGGMLYYGLLEVEVGGRRGYGPYSVQLDSGPRGERKAMSHAYEKRARRPSRATKHRSRDAAEARKVWRKRNRASRGKNRRVRPTSTRRSRPQLKMTISEPGIYFASATEIAVALEVEPGRVKRLIRRGRLSLTNAGHPVAWLAAADQGGIYFYGEAIDSIFTRENVYQLRPGKGLTMGRADGSGSQPVSGGHFQHELHVEEDLFAATVASRAPKEDFWYWSFISAGNSSVGTRSFSFSAPGVTAGSGRAQLSVELYGATEVWDGDDHHVAVRINGVPIGDARWDDIQRKHATFELSSSILLERDNVVEIEGILDSGAPYSIFYVDSFELRYPRTYRAVRDELSFSNGSASSVTLSGFSNPGVMVLDVTDSGRPTEVTNATIDETDSHRVSFTTPNGERRYHAVAFSSIRSPNRIWADGPSSLRTRRMSADYLIISPEELLDGASDLADLRRRGGMETLVVSLEDVYDEFTHGIRTPEAVQQLLAFAYRRWRTAPRYVVLLGRGTFDYANADGENLMPVLMTATPNGLFASDVQLADVAGNDGVPEMMLGRIPVLSNEELSSYVEKLARHEASFASGERVALMVADNPDPAGNFSLDSDYIAELLPEALNVERIYLSELSGLEAREQLFTSLRAGASFVNYVGHGGFDRFADEGVLMASDAAALGNTQFPVMAALTCSVGRFELPGFVSLAEALVTEPNGGVIAVWSPSGLSLHSEAMRLNRAFVEALGATTEPTTLGEAAHQALRDYAEHGHFPFMSRIYNILGDPAALVQ